ncbi:unnamed protein product [Ceutorhynchus assimilis]|uniref:Uncharacterized protein n=1 Tax=Ceutorhynchus assimilis TaxID=467358 RepID=A0A9N9QPV2_9CUCU|nr:unnamed protein product [Ceutorhynchus assimilis]
MWKSKKKTQTIQLEDQVDQAWNECSLDAPRIPNPVPKDTRDLRRMCLVVHLALPLAKVIFGARYVNSCPTNDWLPTYMLVGGLLQLGFLLVLVYKPLRQPALLGCVGMGIIIWMLVGKLQVYSIIVSLLNNEKNPPLPSSLSLSPQYYVPIFQCFRAGTRTRNSVRPLISEQHCSEMNLGLLFNNAVHRLPNLSAVQTRCVRY